MLSLDYVILFSFSLVLRWGVSLWPYSGAGVKPLHGDYEAQRHWQEVTLHLPIQDWYNQTKDNDLQYWGLDYPPLTAYHSNLVGRLANMVNSSFTELHTSRGIESAEHKLFMRLSVVVADLLVFFPAIRIFSGSNPTAVSLLLSLYPGLILIDHGHFQYNNISLGLFILAAAMIFRNRDISASVLFCLALNYKQMELYHALPFFFYLLARCLHQPSILSKLANLALIGLAVITTFLVVWSPFLAGGLASVLQVVNRIFPVNRGIFEDKVANFWCSLDMLLKLRQRLSVNQLGFLCLATTFICSLPCNLHLLFSPGSVRSFILAQLNTALVFFLFSFHVHEKTILLVAIPAILALSVVPANSLFSRTLVPWFLAISTFSMVPLLQKDGLIIPTCSLSVLFLALSANMEAILPKTITRTRISSPLPVEPESMWVRCLSWVKAASLAGCAVLTCLALFYPPPQRYPYLWPALISLYSAVHFMGFLVAFHVTQLYQANPLPVSAKKYK